MYKRNKKYLLYRILVSHLLIMLVLICGNLTYASSIMLWLLTVLFPNLILSFLKNLKSINIKKEHIELIFDKQFLKERTEKYEYSNLKFTYKNEFEGASSLSMKFRIYKKDDNKSIISIGGLLDGWYEEQINDIVVEL